jgi:hypothetical protein
MCLRRYRYDDIYLVVMFNTPFDGWLNVQKVLKKVYSPLFGKILWTGFR